MNNKPYFISNDNQNKGIYRSLEQIWKSVSSLQQKVTRIVGLCDIDYKLSDLLFFINKNERGYTVKRITSDDSPYTFRATDRVLFCNTDDDDIVVRLPHGKSGINCRVINTGDSGNFVYLSPQSGETLYGGSSTDTLYDGEYEDLVYDKTDGWW